MTKLTKAPAVSMMTRTEIMRLIKDLMHRQDEINKSYNQLMLEARKRDFQAAKGNPTLMASYTLTLTGPEQDKAEASFYERLMRVSAMILVLKVAAGITPVSDIKVDKL